MEDKLALDPVLLREVEASCVCFRIQRASRAVGRRYDDAFRHLGLNNWQFSLLAAVEGSEAPSVNELAAFMGMDRTTMTRNLGVLQRRGLLTMSQDKRDSRIKRVVLTTEGRGLLLKALEHWRPVNDTTRAAIPSQDLPAVWQALGRLSHR